MKGDNSGSQEEQLFWIRMVSQGWGREWDSQKREPRPRSGILDSEEQISTQPLCMAIPIN